MPSKMRNQWRQYREPEGGVCDVDADWPVRVQPSPTSVAVATGSGRGRLPLHNAITVAMATGAVSPTTTAHAHDVRPFQGRILADYQPDSGRIIARSPAASQRSFDGIRKAIPRRAYKIHNNRLNMQGKQNKTKHKKIIEVRVSRVKVALAYSLHGEINNNSNN